MSTVEIAQLANYVGGTWRPANGADTLDDVDPATGEVSALVPLSGAKQVREAVEAARAAQPELASSAAAAAGAGAAGTA